MTAETGISKTTLYRYLEDRMDNDKA
ncbi:hypothetical protein SFC51_02630 [Bacillus altitudinis]